MLVSGLTHLATFAGSITLGGVMKALAVSSKDSADREKRHHEFQMASLKATDVSAGLARKEANKPISKTRRFVVVSIISAVIAIMFIGGLTDVAVNVPVTSNEHTFFGFSWGGSVVYEKLNGYVLVPEILLAMNAIISFLFGTTTMKR